MITSKPASHRAQDNNLFVAQFDVRGQVFCGESVYTDLTWAEDMATQGCDQSADSAAGMGTDLESVPRILKGKVILRSGIYVDRKSRSFRQFRQRFFPNPIGLYSPEPRFHLGDKRPGERGGSFIAMSCSEAASYQY